MITGILKLKTILSTEVHNALKRKRDLNIRRTKKNVLKTGSYDKYTLSAGVSLPQKE